MKTNKIHFLLHTLFLCFSLNAQVGINETDPQAMLDIKASSQGTPAATDGVLIPRVDAFPVTNPTAAQNGMLVYLTTTVGSNTPGFYYWDSAWIKIISGGDDNDWHKESTSLSPASINDNIFTHGNVGIGTNNPTSRLHVIDTVAGPVVDIVNRITSDDEPAIRAVTNSTAGYGIGAEFIGGFKGIEATAGEASTSAPYELTGVVSEAIGPGGRRVGGSFTASGGTQNYALKLVDGNQADGLILTSDASGYATWKKAVIDNIVSPDIGAGVDVPHTTGGGTYLQTGSSITLPPGKFAVNVTMLLARNDSGYVPTPDNSQFWIRTTFSDSNLANPVVSPDILGTSRLISGSLGGSSRFGLAIGTVIINNTSGANKTYYYVAGDVAYYPSSYSFTLTGFGGTAWGENSIIAYRLN